jgi:hypothetical protein
MRFVLSVVVFKVSQDDRQANWMDVRRTKVLVKGNRISLDKVMRFSGRTQVMGGEKLA